MCGAKGVVSGYDGIRVSCVRGKRCRFRADENKVISRRNMFLQMYIRLFLVHFRLSTLDGTKRALPNVYWSTYQLFYPWG